MSIEPQRLQELFLKLSQLPAAERVAAFHREGVTDPKVWERLSELLRAHDAPGSSLGLHGESAAGGPPSSVSPGDADSEQTFIPANDVAVLQDDSIATQEQAPVIPAAQAMPLSAARGEEGAVVGGRYVLLQKIGEGGMGEVWVARQTEPVKRRVALKLIRAGMDSRGVLQRFEQERQALALMDHPHIARVFDGGVTATGQPYFVMELVNGLPLTKFCDELKLGIRERLQLILPICQAVQHAHQKGIIHRDLKPANILVTMVDGRPVPKVIDFGVAKATSGKLTEKTLSTQFGAVVGTLEYMAPEQAGYTTDDIDTRADLYSLGVILYELLTGFRPLDSKRLKQKALHEMIRILREDEPSKPSTRLSTEEALPSLAALRQTEPKRLMAMMRGELDWVVMKCLEKQRNRRYETANGLARDIERYLADEPVEARPPSTGYRLRKLLRRNRITAVTTGLVLMALVGGIIGTTWGLLRAQQAQEAEAKRVQERDDALAKMEGALEQEAEALRQEGERVEERDSALKIADNRLEELTYQRGIDKFLLARSAYESNNAWAAIEQLLDVPEAQRGWEWRYLRSQMRGLFSLYGHEREVTSVAFSSDGTRIVTGSWDLTAKVWNAQTGAPLLDLKGHTR
ncbi:MAG: serine/threonine-protein kinase, partial [Planctomycetota bacterium]|nr:serine/threonine-protein kinase [Planctomycetota bacterium]